MSERTVIMSRIILKLSGEALAGDDGTGFGPERIRGVASQVKALTEQKYEVGIVIGGGNFIRGRSTKEIERTKADSIGMLATVMNCIYVSEMFRNEGMETVVMTPFQVGSFTKLFSRDLANEYFAKGAVVFFAGGTGHPFFSTDTGVVLRAIEVGAEVILMAKNVDGVYDSDPVKNPDAIRYDILPIQDVIDKNLQAVDMTASILARDYRMPMRVFDLKEEGSIVKAASGNFNGTTITV
jgi:uridylate kinase